MVRTYIEKPLSPCVNAKCTYVSFRLLQVKRICNSLMVNKTTTKIAVHPYFIVKVHSGQACKQESFRNYKAFPDS